MEWTVWLYISEGTKKHEKKVTKVTIANPSNLFLRFY